MLKHALNAIFSVTFPKKNAMRTMSAKHAIIRGGQLTNQIKKIRGKVS